MRPPRSLVARLIAGLLLLQWAAAVMPHARAMAVELCSPSGMRTVLVDENGKPVEKSQDPSCCELCQGPAAIEADGPPTPRRIVYAAESFPAGPAGLPPFPPRAPPQQPRAPPAA
ncbi:hypothetical protein [Roseomonas xinghualingensis]|uniref:hypothetical protein n=1 Tax=Roseomonas xinghualingensis TaxID=2986475 RepID=UPI0021F0E206|nr:hypothetical protein [Roseomonas sp. SXEYE001]MCV4208258.1 hypothetical protein [Roseomonas sp. SXEYE001]